MSNDSSPSKATVLPRVGVGAVVFKNDAVLLVKRARPPAENEWAIPGGKVRPGETLQQAAEREILEETGIIIHAREPVYTFELIEKENDGTLRFHYVITDLAADYVSGDLRAGDDARDAQWVNAEQLDPLRLNITTRKLLKEKYDFTAGK